MRDFLQSPLFEPVAEHLKACHSALLAADHLHLHAPASLEGVLAMGFIEAACLDLGLRYKRRFFLPKSHRPRDEGVSIPTSDHGFVVVLDVEEETWDVEERSLDGPLNLVPLKTRLRLGSQHHVKSGALDTVIQCAALAAAMAPNGRRVRSLRPYASMGLWLRGGLDTSVDPIHSLVILHLKEEGSVRMVPLPEVALPAEGMIPGLSQLQLKRLRRSWSKMDVDARTTALSELVLPSLAAGQLSTPRLEELVWHRMLVGDGSVDLASQVHLLQRQWPTGVDELRLHASVVLDGWISTGVLLMDERATG